LAITEIRNRMTVLDSGFRNLLDPSKVDVRGGYRDVKMNIQLNGHIVEMQISIPEIIAVKKVRHLEYEQQAEIERAAIGRQYTEAEQAKIDGINAKSKEAYDLAWAAVLKHTNSSADIGPPLRRAESAGNGRGGSVSQAEAPNLEPGILPNETGMPSTSKNSTDLGKSTGLGKTGVPDSSIENTSIDNITTGAASDKVIPFVEQALSDRPTMEIPVDGEIKPAVDAIKNANHDIAKAEADAPGFEAAVTCFLRD